MGVSTALKQANPTSARDLCLTILQAVEDFMPTPPTHNDVTALALVRTS